TDSQGAELISVSEPIDDSAIGHLMQVVIQAISEFFSENLAWETRKGQRQNAKQGWHNGGRAPLGYRLTTITDSHGVERRTYELDPDASKIETVQQIFHWYVNEPDLGVGGIATRLNNLKVPTIQSAKGWHSSTVWQMLRNGNYTGRKVWNQRNSYGDWLPMNEWVWSDPGAHPEIVPWDTFEKAQTKLEAWEAERKKKQEERGSGINRGGRPLTGKNGIPTYALTGLLICDNCGSHYIGKPSHRYVKDGTAKIYRRYVCNGHLKRGQCQTKYVYCSTVESKVLDALKSWIGRDVANREEAETALESIRLAHEGWGSTKAELEAELDGLNAEAQRYLDLVGKMGSSELAQERLETTEQKIKQLRNRITLHANQEPISVEQGQMESLLTVWRNLWGDAWGQHLWPGEAMEDHWWLVAFRHIVREAHFSADQKLLRIRFGLPINISKEKAVEWMQSWEDTETIEPWQGPVFTWDEEIRVEKLTLN
ncbi:MAG: recombinase family protein, partial [Firmicutes bacterium]|nr:recombinase family protein [Bacillota bacterium]